MDALLQQLTQLHDLPQQEQRDATLLRRSITVSAACCTEPLL